MTHPRYKLNYAFNFGSPIHRSSEILNDVSKLSQLATVDNGLHEVLKLFLLTTDKNLAQEVKDKLRSIANSLYGDNTLDVKRETFLEAVDINIVCVSDLSLWDTEQWCLRDEIEVTEDPLF